MATVPLVETQKARNYHYTKAGVDTGQMAGPTRQDYEAHKNDNPNQYASQDVRPNKSDSIESKKVREESERADKIRAGYDQRKSEEAEARKEEIRKAKKKQKGWIGNRKPGIEMPKQGLHRLGYASRGLGEPITHASPEEFGGYGDSFAMGGADSGLSLSIGNRRRGGVNFGGYSSPFEGLGEALTANGQARGFGGYQDPFAGAAKAPRVRRTSKAAPKRAKRKQGRPKKRSSSKGRGQMSGIGSFKLGLF